MELIVDEDLYEVALRKAGECHAVAVVRHLISAPLYSALSQEVHDYVLHYGAANGHVDLVIWALDKGADVHVHYECALRWAAKAGHIRIVELLLEAGADVHVHKDYAMSWAVHNGHEEVVRLLESCGAL